jgi:acetyltransferase-like isoleucine patch superfamily enzyme
MTSRVRHIAWRLSYQSGPRLMSALRKRWQVFRNPNATIRFGAHVVAGPGFKVHAPFGGTLLVGNEVEFRRNTTFEFWGPDSRVTIGDRCRLTYDVVVQCGTSITIGNDVLLAAAAMVVDGSHRFRDLALPSVEQGYDFKPITISDGVIVHAKVTVIDSIGERSIIGANAVVAKPIPAFSVAVGVPAKVVEYFGPRDHQSTQEASEGPASGMSNVARD